MKYAAKTKRKGAVKRDLFAELREGMTALAKIRQGKRASGTPRG